MEFPILLASTLFNSLSVGGYLDNEPIAETSLLLCFSNYSLKNKDNNGCKNNCAGDMAVLGRFCAVLPDQCLCV